MDFVALLREEKLKRKQKIAQDQQANVNDEKVTVKEVLEKAVPKFEAFPPLTTRNLDLESFRVNIPLQSVYYIPGFISENEHEQMLAQVYCPAAQWVKLKWRSLQSYGGTPGPGMIPEALPPWLDVLSNALVKAEIFDRSETPNHVLLNEYQPGQGIMAHSDGPVYKPLVACLSMSGSCILKFSPRVATGELGLKDCSSGTHSLVLRPRSLLVFRDSAYSDSMHGIQDCRAEVVPDDIANGVAAKVAPGDVIQRDTRISLTVRHVLCSTTNHK